MQNKSKPFKKGISNAIERERVVASYWKENNIMKKSFKRNSDKEKKNIYTFYEGPPTANGKPHIGHISTRAVKDIILRYKRMKGYRVYVKAGWDTHGLPVEIEVEKNLNIGGRGKKEIEIYGEEKFIQACKESVWKYKNEWEEITTCTAFWADIEHPYVTYENDYIESVWWALKEIWKKNLLYNGYKVVPYCSRCGTALSSHEVAQGYKTIEEKSLIVKFKLIRNDDNLNNKFDEYFLAWTTTPWTLPSNVALVVNPNEKYLRVEYNKEIFILASTLLDEVFSYKQRYENKTEKLNYKVIDEIAGCDLVGTKYLRLFDYKLFDNASNKNFCCVVCDDYVTLDDGTGIVHCSPAFGEDDARVGKDNNLVFAQPVDMQGKFTDVIYDLKDMFVKEADPIIIKKLKDDNKLFCVIDYKHNYPFCWRCDTPLLYYARNSWFIKVSEFRNELINNNNKINWVPDNIKYGRFGNFLENAVDWSLSRDRYWGTPLNIWQCECGYQHSVGSVDELKSMSDNYYEGLELHKPYIDKIYLNCPQCNKKMKRVPEVIDCWFDSGAMPFAQLHYPFENQDIFEDNFPANFICEAIDQTRGWFYTLLVISTLLFNQESYKNVVVLGHVQDKFGQKMSKHKGNVVNPWDILNKFGADLIRWYFYYNSALYLPIKFYINALNDIKIFNTIWNVYSFFVLYANIDELDVNRFNCNGFELKLDNIIDKWILSKLNCLIRDVDNFLSEFKITEASRVINSFVGELSNWYVRRSRDRFWASGMPQDKINAYMTLYKVLLNLSKVLAPFAPFISEEIYLNLTQNTLQESVHLEDFPEIDQSLINKSIEDDMDLALSIVELGHSARNSANIKNRQPLSKMFIVNKNNQQKIGKEYLQIIIDELNIKEVEFIEEKNEINFVNYTVKPNLKTLGKKYGKLIPAIEKYLFETDSYNLIERLKISDVVLNVYDNDIILQKEDVLIEVNNKPEFVLKENKSLKVILCVSLNEQLIEEGFIRELISKIQTMRKEANFDVMDRIIIYNSGNKNISDIFNKNIDVFKKETLCIDIVSSQLDGFIKKWNINNQEVSLGVKKV